MACGNSSSSEHIAVEITAASLVMAESRSRCVHTAACSIAILVATSTRQMCSLTLVSDGSQVVVGWVTDEGSVLERCVTRRIAITQSKEVQSRCILDMAETGA